MASLYSSALTSLFLACTCFVMFFIQLSMVPVMVQTTVGRLKELKDYPCNSTWFKDHLKVFSDQK